MSFLEILAAGIALRFMRAAYEKHLEIQGKYDREFALIVENYERTV